MSREIKIGDRVSYQYTHWLNSKSSTQIVKYGTLINIGRTKKRFMAEWTDQVGIVLFDGNKTTSRIRFDLLNPLTPCPRKK